jgi:hypothetical protein
LTTVHLDSLCPDNERRERLYDGEVFVFSPRPASLALVEFAREMLEEAFGAIDPRFAQYEMPVEEYVSIMAPLKPRFMHHSKTKLLIGKLLEDLGCNRDLTFQDVPRFRMVTSDGYLTAGVGYAHPPHRDTWYSAPLAQLNWWLPIFDIESESSMAFHPQYWSEATVNTSSDFNYYDWNSHGRKSAATQIKTDTRRQPGLVEPIELDPQVRLVPPAGGIVLFSAAQLHSTVPNTTKSTRYSIDFRTVHLTDLLEGAGAPNLDSDCTGTSLRDFLRVSDLQPLPDDVVSLYDSGPIPDGAELVYRPPAEPTH